MSNIVAFDAFPDRTRSAITARATPAVRAEPISDITCCPRCRSPLRFVSTDPFCSDISCFYAQEGFPLSNGQMVLIDFEHSVFSRRSYQASSGSVFVRDDSGTGIRARFRRFVTGTNRVAARNCARMVATLKARVARPRILIIGGGAIGAGLADFYEDPDIEIVGTDVYSSTNTRVVADAHRLPFKDEVFDGVWVQAVLEHVLEPWKVPDEIYRVLKADGVVYADTPFMQQVHEEAYDFTRFTLSGHRWLFRRFQQIDAGTVGGAGTAFVWSIRYLARALGAPNKLATLITLPFFWIRFLDRLTKTRSNGDAASGIYFLGLKSALSLTPKQITAYYYQH